MLSNKYKAIAKLVIAPACLMVTCVGMAGTIVETWGTNVNGQLGDGTIINRLTPVEVLSASKTPLADAASLVQGKNFACARLHNGYVECWGNNADGQLGNGTTTSSMTPVVVSGITDAVGIVAGEAHVCALLKDGSVDCWGSNSHGQIGAASSVKFSDVPVKVALSQPASVVSAGFAHTCAGLASGGVDCWGQNSNGQLGNGTTTDSYSPVAVTGLTAVKDELLAAGDQHTCAMISTGTAYATYCWGSGTHGQLGNGETVTSLTPVVTKLTGHLKGLISGSLHTCALLDDGKVYCWGDNSASQLGSGVQGQLYSDVPVEVQDISATTSIFAGPYHTCSISSGKVYCWGMNGEGQIGDGTKDEAKLPTAVSITVGTPELLTAKSYDNTSGVVLAD